jgi:MFS family permease
MQEFSIGSSAHAGFLMTVVVLPGIFLAFPAGIIIGKYGVRLVGIIAIFLVAVGSLAAASANSFMTLLLGRLILGIGSPFIVTAMPTMISQWFPREEGGKAMGFYSTNMPFATVTAFSTASVLMLNYGWRFPFYIGTLVAATASVIFIFLVKDGPLKHNAQKERKNNPRRVFADFEIWKTGAVWALFQITVLSFLSWAPKLFRDYRGLDPVYASLLASVIMFAAILCVPLFGWVSDKARRRKPFLIAGSLFVALALNASAYAVGSSLVISVMILGVVTSMVPPIVMTLPSEVLEPEAVGMGFGIMTLCGNIGSALSAPLMGFFVDVSKSIELSFAGASIFVVLGAVVAYALKPK